MLSPAPAASLERRGRMGDIRVRDLPMDTGEVNGTVPQAWGPCASGLSGQDACGCQDRESGPPGQDARGRQGQAFCTNVAPVLAAGWVRPGPRAVYGRAGLWVGRGLCACGRGYRTLFINNCFVTPFPAFRNLLRTSTHCVGIKIRLPGSTGRREVSTRRRRGRLLDIRVMACRVAVKSKKRV